MLFPGYSTIMLFGIILTKSGKEECPPALIRHEQIHQRQYLECFILPVLPAVLFTPWILTLCPLSFYILYLTEWFISFCWVGCRDRKRCYENVSRKNLGEACPEHICTAPGAEEGYRFSKAMENPGFIGIRDIQDVYMPMGFSNFKIEGRGLGSALVLEFLLYYMTKPEYQLHVREAIYLDNMLDLF